MRNPYEKQNAIVAEINGEMQSLNNSFEVAERWFNRGEDYEACGYYQSVLNSFRRLETLYSDLTSETGNSHCSAKSHEMKKSQNDMLESYGDLCRDAERRLY